MADHQATAAQIAEAGRDLDARGLLASFEGNLSVRLDDSLILTTPTGAHKGRLAPEEMVVVDASGTTVGQGKASSEVKLHLAIYEERADVGAIVHAHPPTATGYAVAGVPLPHGALAESTALFGCVPVAPYGTPSTAALADSVREPVRTFDAILLANHGAVTVGQDLNEAKERMVQLEHFAHIALVAHLLGGAQALEPDQIAEISQMRESAGGGPIPPVCYPAPEQAGTITLSHDELVRLIADAVRTIG
ncbi:MAG: class II aldolase/adducin family protein [Acidobacteria bacterium]|nr:class II aldolase/adducin family protein [Acidobacteriota bacterium]